MRKSILLIVAVLMLGSVSQAFGAIELQKAKTGGHALGIRLGMTTAELDGLYKWLPSDHLGYRVAFLDYEGHICIVEVKKDIVSAITVRVFTESNQDAERILKSMIPDEAYNTGKHAGLQYTAVSLNSMHMAYLISFIK